MNHTRRNIVYTGLVALVILGVIVNPSSYLGAIVLLVIITTMYLRPLERTKGSYTNPAGGEFYEHSPQQQVMTIDVPSSMPAEVEWYNEFPTPNGEIIEVCARLKSSTKTEDNIYGNRRSNSGGKWR